MKTPIEIYSNLWLKTPLSAGLSFPKFQMGTVFPDLPILEGDYQNTHGACKAPPTGRLRRQVG